MTGIYSLYIDPDSPTEVRKAIYDIVRADSRITGWWNHVPGLYLLETSYNADDLMDLFEKPIKPWCFLVMRVSLDDMQGWMPKRGWDWVTQREGATEQVALQPREKVAP